MAIELESIASIGVLVANAVFIIVSVATYLRMNAHEQSRQNFIVRALKDTREAGREMKAVARDLARLMERAERARVWQNKGIAAAPTALGPLDDEVPFEEPEPNLERLRPLDSLAGMTNEAYAEWQRLHQVELDRVLSQRRRLQSDLAAAQARQLETDKLISSLRLRNDQALRERQLLKKAQAELDQAQERQEQDVDAMAQLRQQIAALEGRLQRNVTEKAFIEDRLLALDAMERQLQAVTSS